MKTETDKVTYLWWLVWIYLGHFKSEDEPSALVETLVWADL